MSQKKMKGTKIITSLGLLLIAFAISGCEDGVLAEIEEQVSQAKLADYTLTIIESEVGTVTPTGAINLKDGDSTEIQAIEQVGFPFVRWEQVSGSGNANFLDANSESTTVTLTDGNATVQAIWDDAIDPSGSINIEDKINISGTDYRNDRTIDITLTYSDNSGGVPWMKLSASSFGEGTSSGWIPAAVSANYTFPSDGPKTVYARFRDESGNESPLYSTDIYIDTTPPIRELFGVWHASNPTQSRDYVTGVSDSDIVLVYEARDDASGVEKVYFSNSTVRPGTAQIQSYSEPTSPFAWELTPYTYIYGDYSVYVWFEDKLGNRSQYMDTVRYDDQYEGRFGNNSADAVSGATLIIDDSADEDSRLALFTGKGTAKLKDADYYKFGFWDSYYDAVIKLDLNTIDPDPRVTFYDHNRNVITPDSVTDPPDYFDLQYTFSLPYVNTGGYPYYIYMRVDRNASVPYDDDLSYDIGWEFYYNGM